MSTTGTAGARQASVEEIHAGGCDPSVVIVRGAGPSAADSAAESVGETDSTTECAVVPSDLTAESAHRIMQQHAHWSGTPCARRAAALQFLVAEGRYVLDSRRCRVRVAFTSLGVEMEYQSTKDIAELFAERMRLRPDSEVTVDDHIDPDLPPLPCAQLWSA